MAPSSKTARPRRMPGPGGEGRHVKLTHHGVPRTGGGRTGARLSVQFHTQVTTQWFSRLPAKLGQYPSARARLRRLLSWASTPPRARASADRPWGGMSTGNTKWVAALAGITLTLNMSALLGHIRSNPTPVLPPLLDEGGGLVDVDVDASDHLDIGHSGHIDVDVDASDHLDIGHNDHDEHMLPRTHAAAAAAAAVPVHKTSGVEPGYTIVLNTFRRNPCLKVALDHWVTCHPTSIVVVWPDPEVTPPPPPLPRTLAHTHARTHIHTHTRVHTTTITTHPS